MGAAGRHRLRQTAAHLRSRGRRAVRSSWAASTALRELGGCSAHFHGVDLDREATHIAADALRQRGHERVHIGVGDGLVDHEHESFDCILTNPPWETLQDGPDARSRVATLRPHFTHQGKGKLYTYRLFLERAVQLLRPGGRLGAIVPASLWFDRDAEPLRRLLLDACEWQWLFGFENRERIFDIDSRYRFGRDRRDQGREHDVGFASRSGATGSTSGTARRPNTSSTNARNCSD